jgi:two-component system phosphate regulon response regulator PhoB
MNILVIEDDTSIREMIALSLTQAGYQVNGCADVKTAKKQIAEMQPDGLVVDWMLPDSSGIELIRWLRRQPGYRHIPALMLTARAEESDKIEGLESGADDYMTKPLSLRELRSRIKALLRRPGQYEAEVHILKSGPIQLNSETHRVQIDNKNIELSKTEYQLLKFFMSHQNRVFTRDQILSAVWGNDAYLGDRTIDVHILRLRKILKPFKLEHCIKTVRGTGYSFSVC